MRRLALAALLVVPLLFAVVSGASAAEPQVIEMSVDGPDQPTVGDRIRFVIKLEADRGTTVFLAPGTLPDELSLARTPEVKSRDTSGGAELTLTVEVAAFVPGDIDVPPLQLRYRERDGATGEIETPPSALRIASVLPTGGGAIEPKDLKPQAEIGSVAPVWIAPALVAVTIALLVVLGLLFWETRRRKAVVLAPVMDVAALNPEDRARLALDRAGDEFIVEGDYVAYYSTIAATVRSYLTERFSFPAFALTTSELQERMVYEGMDRWQARLVGGLLSQADAVVFAHYRPARERADADLTAAYEIVEISRPEPPAPAEPAPAKEEAVP